uniref:Ribonuclease H n=1 Tax=Psychotria viridis TaxID=189196 RepID=A0A977PLG3_9GENT|nr:Ribonuclease H [Psychotria viridis]UXD78706.1 Ribonuclease H [Psychotria viridis]
MNIDGSSLGNPGMAGGGIVVRDSFGRVLHACSVSFGHATSFQAELKALIHGLELCQQLGLTHGTLEMDSKMVVDMINGCVSCPWRFYHELHGARVLLRSLSLHLTHILRESNAVADYLAKLASLQQASITFAASDLPPFVKGLVSLDRVQYPL